MKLTIWVYITFTVVLKSVIAEPVGKCPNEMRPEEVDFLVDSHDCSVFYKCDWGKQVKYYCPDNLHFNRKLNVCDWPGAAGCHGSPNPLESTTVQGCDNNECGGGSATDGGNGSNGECPNDPCPKENGAFPVYFSHPKICGRFCQCDWGIGYDMPCPDGLHFNTELNVCDWPKAAGCDGSSNHTPTPPGPGCDDDGCSGGTTIDNGNGSNGECPNDPCPKENGAFPVYFAHPKTCGRFCQCDWGIGYDMSCPDGLHFNTELNVCDWPEAAGCDGSSNHTPTPPGAECDDDDCSSGTTVDNGNGSNGECPNDPCPKENGAFPVYFAHPKICGRFCQCDWGIGYDMPCPDGLHFNTELNVCDWPEAAGCDGSSNHTPTPPGSGCDDGGCSSGTTVDNGNGSNGECPNDPCPKENGAFPVYFAHPKICGRFCQCDWGIGYDMPCPDGLHFNTELNVCDWPEAAGCDGSSNHTPTPPGAECDDDDCSSGTTVDNGNGSNGECPNDPCPKENGAFPVYFAHPKICGRFCQCDWGIGYDMPCPDGLHFNTELNVCDWPETAGCDGFSKPVSLRLNLS